MRNFRNLEIWKLGMEIVKMTYQLVKKLPNSELFGLSLQMRKSVISMPSNIAEGCSRSSNKELLHYLEISIGSSFELETQYMASVFAGYLQEQEIQPVIEKLNIFQKKTNTYMQTLK